MYTHTSGIMGKTFNSGFQSHNIHNLMVMKYIVFTGIEMKIFFFFFFPAKSACVMALSFFHHVWKRL